jgi:hypothetical protein
MHGNMNVKFQGEVKRNIISAHIWTSLGINSDNGAIML